MRTILIDLEPDRLSEKQLGQIRAAAPDMRVLWTRDLAQIEAGLDVFAIEPLPKDSPLWDMENVILTGHYAGMTPHYDERALAIFLDNLQRYRTGQPLHNIVDKRLGY